MIVTFFLNLFFSVIRLLVDFLPNGHLPSQITSAFTYYFGAANLFSYIIPIGTIVSALLVIIAFDGIVLIWHFINWIIRKIPGMQ